MILVQTRMLMRDVVRSASILNYFNGRTKGSAIGLDVEPERKKSYVCHTHPIC